jgi:hypothetical protein
VSCRVPVVWLLPELPLRERNLLDDSQAAVPGAAPDVPVGAGLAAR